MKCLFCVNAANLLCIVDTNNHSLHYSTYNKLVDTIKSGKVDIDNLKCSNDELNDINENNRVQLKKHFERTFNAPVIDSNNPSMAIKADDTIYKVDLGFKGGGITSVNVRIVTEQYLLDNGVTKYIESNEEKDIGEQEYAEEHRWREEIKHDKNWHTQNKSINVKIIKTIIIEGAESKLENVNRTTGNTSRLEFDEDEEEIAEELQAIYSEYKQDCDICGGTGRIKDRNGFIGECKCGEEVAKIKSITECREEKKPVINIKNADRQNMVDWGLIPECYIDIDYDDGVMVNILRDELKYFNINNKLNDIDKRYGIAGFERLSAAMNNIIVSCKTGRKLKHSYLLAGEKGFGKKTFVYTCLKNLYVRNTPHICKYISLHELGFLKAQSVKRAQAMSNIGYYSRDNDRELVQKAIVEEGKKTIDALMKNWFDIIKEDNNAQIATRAFGYSVNSELPLDEQKLIRKREKESLWNQLEISLLDTVYARTREEERIINSFEEYQGKLVNTWEDYLKSPIVFVFFSGRSERQFETEILQTLINIRGAKGLPTIAIMETALSMFQDEKVFIDNGDESSEARLALIKTRSYYWDSMISNVCSIDSKKSKAAEIDNEIQNNVEYDRMIHISSYYALK